MAMCILWPNLPAQLVSIVTEAVGSGFETVFREKFDDVTDEEWARADAVVGGCPPQYIDKLRNWMSPNLALRVSYRREVNYLELGVRRKCRAQVG